MKAALQQRPTRRKGRHMVPPSERANTRFSYLHYSYSLEHETAALLCACSTKISERSLALSVRPCCTSPRIYVFVSSSPPTRLSGGLSADVGRLSHPSLSNALCWSP